MNWGLIYIAALVCSIGLGFALSLKLSFLVLFWGGIGLVLAYPVLHNIPNKNLASAMFLGLAVFASFPLKQLLLIDGVLPSILITLVYAAILYVAGLGWKRSWS